MNADKVKLFMQLAGQPLSDRFAEGSERERQLGAQLLLSEVLEYVIVGLGVTPVVNGQAITNPEALQYEVTASPNRQEMLDGLADVAYTMYWNANAFGIPLEEGFDLVCDNNLEKFIELGADNKTIGSLAREHWHCNKNVGWPPEVARVEVIEINETRYAVGKDERGKVRKPLHFKSVDLTALIAE